MTNDVLLEKLVSKIVATQAEYILLNSDKHPSVSYASIIAHNHELLDIILENVSVDEYTKLFVKASEQIIKNTIEGN